MHDFLKKNKKKLLAVFTAVLMVSFLYSPANRSGGGASGRRALIGNLGKTPVYADEKRLADSQWRMLEQSYREDQLLKYLGGMFRGEQGQMILGILRNRPDQLVQFLGQAQQRGVEVMALDLLGPSIRAQVKDHGDLFFLLIKEAERRGIRISDDTAATAAKNEILPILPSAANDTSYRDAVRSLLMVQALRDQVVSNAKFSEPQWKQMYAESLRGVRLNIVEYTAEQLRPFTAPPTTQQVDSLYADFKNTAPDSAKPTGDSLAFAYQVPNRVKLQYFKIARDKVMETAKAAHRDSKDKPDEIPFDLKTKAYEHYLQNQEKYVRQAPATQPATAPATRPVLGPDFAATQPTTGPTTVAAASQPATPVATTRPFSEVAGEIVDDLIKPEAEKLETQVSDALRQRLSDDYYTFQRTKPTTLPTSLPAVASAIAATTKPAYDSFDYLDQVAKDIQRQFGVLPEVTQVAEWQDAKALADLPGIGLSHTTKDSESFTQYAAQLAAPFVETPTNVAEKSLHLWQPSEQMTDSTQNAYVFRLTDANPAHAPSLADVRTRVEEDARLKNSYTAAIDAAKKFIDAAKRDSFSRAALDDHRNPVQTEAFNITDVLEGREIKNLQMGREASTAVALKAKDLLAQSSPSNPRPMALLPIPALKKVLVIQLDSVMMLSPEETQYGRRLQMAEGTESYLGETLAGPYFKYDAVVTRLEYKPQETSKSGS